MIGLASTDQLYFASGHLGCPGAMFTASHNPAQYNGIKLCRAGAAAGRHGDRAAPRSATRSSRRRPSPAVRPGRSPQHDVLEAYAAHLLVARAASTGRRLQGGRRRRQRHGRPHGAGGLRPARRGRVELVPMYFELDGTFPNHEANPIEPRTSSTSRRGCVAEGADLGLAFDGDADRCFLVDERGRGGVAVDADRADRRAASWPRSRAPR